MPRTRIQRARDAIHSHPGISWGTLAAIVTICGVIAPGVRLTGREMTEIKPLVAVSAPSAFTLVGLGAGLLGLAMIGQRRRR